MQFRALGRKDAWRRKRQPTPVSLPGESHGQGSLAGSSPWSRKESDRIERLNNNRHLNCLHHISQASGGDVFLR